MAYLRICPLCQKRLPASARFCGRCGIHLDEALESFRAFAASASQTRVYTSPHSTAPVAKPTPAPPWPADPYPPPLGGRTFPSRMATTTTTSPPRRCQRRPRSRVAPMLFTFVALLGAFTATLRTSVVTPVAPAGPAVIVTSPAPRMPMPAPVPPSNLYLPAAPRATPRERRWNRSWHDAPSADDRSVEPQQPEAPRRASSSDDR